MASVPKPRPGIADIAAYVPGRESAGAGVRTFKLSSNENPLGPSPKAVEAYRDVGQRLHRYPDGGAHDLRRAIAARHGLNPERIVCGAGSDEILQLLSQGYLGPGDEAIHTAHGFLVYPIVIRARGATPVVAEENNLTASVDAILARVSERTRLVFLANPNNPTGTYVPFDEVKRLHAGLPGDCLLVIDAAYAEYVSRNDYEAGVELVGGNDNVVMTRTFSKAFGLAAVRLGWAYCPAGVADTLNRIRGPFNVSAPALAAGVAAIGDEQHLAASVAHNDRWLAWLRREITALGIEVTPSVANFLLLHFPADDNRNAAAADAFLARHGFVLRAMGGYGLPGALRLSVGSEEANRGVVEALAQFMGKEAR